MLDSLSSSFTSLTCLFHCSWFEAYTTWKTSSFDVFASGSYADAAAFYADVQAFLSNQTGRKYIYVSKSKTIVLRA